MSEESTDSKSLVFSFGDPEPVLNRSPMEYLGAFLDMSGDFYRPPVSLTGLADCVHANGHHMSALYFKRDMIVKWLAPGGILPRSQLRWAAQDYVVLGNAYFQKIYNRLGGIIGLRALPGLTMRRGKKPGVFFQIRADGGKPIEFAEGEVIHLLEPDVKQGIYGIPGYFGGLQSVLLAEDTVLFRRKYFLNGSHMGYILVTTDAGLDDTTAGEIERRVKESKGPGNFRSLYINIPRSTSREPVKVIPVGDIATKDEFDKIASITTRQVLGMHRMQPGLAGVIPENTAGFGDPEKIMRVYHELEITALQSVFLELNEHLPLHRQIEFVPPAWSNT